MATWATGAVAAAWAASAAVTAAGRDLRLKGRGGGGGVSHPKRNKDCGLELE
jgi:hypothetical protein